tara:strand:- start:1037 stop:1447 length:411 start_codon:yes stop_codon:yes gene_type:complete
MGANSGPATYVVGLNNVGSYQVSSVPYITGSTTLAAGVEISYEFPMVTKSITVINRSGEDIRVHFNSTGSGNVVDGNHFVLFDSKEDSYTFNVKCKEIYVSAPAANGGNASFTIVAELTQIDNGKMFALTGSGLTD